MISRDLVLTITDKTTTLDKSIILYRYDRGITFNITLKSDTYNINESEICKARALILRPNKQISATDIADIVDGVYVLYLDDSWTDQTQEIGIYTIQLQLYSENTDDECITIQPFTFEVKTPIGIPDDSAAYVNYATVGNYSIRASVPLPTGDLENGQYLATKWLNNDLITDSKLNKIEDVLTYLVTDSATHATESYVNDAIANADLGENIDLTDYALKTDIPTNTSQLTNDSGFLTEHQDISGKSDIGHTHDDYLTSIPDEYVTDTELNAKGYLTEHQSLANYALKTDIPTIPTDVSAFNNDAGYVDSDYIDDYLSVHNYVTESDLSSKNYIDYYSLDSYLYNYATKDEVPTKTSELTNDSGFIAAIPSEYVTETELNAKGYLTEHQSLDGYATETFVTTKISEAQLGGEGGSVNLDDYALKTDVPTKTSELTNDSGFITSIPSEYITETELNAKNLISSGTITRIEVVSALPSTEETGVLYIVKSE